MLGGIVEPCIAGGGYRLEFLQVRSGRLHKALAHMPGASRQERRQPHVEPVRYVALGEYDALLLREAASAREALRPAEASEHVLSVFVLPAFRWNVNAPGLKLCQEGSWEYPLLAVFCLKIAVPWSHAGSPRPQRVRALPATEAKIYQEISEKLHGKCPFDVCGTIGFFELALLLQSDRLSTFRETLHYLHNMKQLGTGDAAFSSISAVLAMRAQPLSHGLEIANLPASGNVAHAHICLGARQGEFDKALAEAAKEADGNGSPETMFARYDLELVSREVPITSLVARSIRMQTLRSGVFGRVTTAISFGSDQAANCGGDEGAAV